LMRSSNFCLDVGLLPGTVDKPGCARYGALVYPRVEAANSPGRSIRKNENLEDSMKRLMMSVSAAALLVCAATVRAQDLLVPAGTLLQCTLDEPNFSSATAAIGDPVLCHLRTQQEFGNTGGRTSCNRVSENRPEYSRGNRRPSAFSISQAGTLLTHWTASKSTPHDCGIRKGIILAEVTRRCRL